jgi:hypothetical protein
MGFGLPDDHQHAPNEKLHLPTFFRGVETAIWFLAAVGRTHRLRAQPVRRKEAAI